MFFREIGITAIMVGCWDPPGALTHHVPFMGWLARSPDSVETAVEVWVRTTNTHCTRFYPIRSISRIFFDLAGLDIFAEDLFLPISNPLGACGINSACYHGSLLPSLLNKFAIGKL
ncbi:hypothetical protein BS47DRAFT_1403255 [Hydnum rufescens UP504]|uniref:Uncharacterized protein n=1 Tax=Hydnum rufescens UP504 TaxID=1448309 RepID=A0A9P6ACM9_9AGAM|nr:hypothetical protein BS47DRAFT_1403255 [Hydnum rufescens UP504]